MGMKKNNLAMLSMLALASQQGSDVYGVPVKRTPISKEALEEKKKIQLEKLKIKQGLKKFYYYLLGEDGIPIQGKDGEPKRKFVWARNEKNADRKAKNKGYI